VEDLSSDHNRLRRALSQTILGPLPFKLD